MYSPSASFLSFERQTYLFLLRTFTQLQDLIYLYGCLPESLQPLSAALLDINHILVISLQRPLQALHRLEHQVFTLIQLLLKHLQSVNLDANKKTIACLRFDHYQCHDSFNRHFKISRTEFPSLLPGSVSPVPRGFGLVRQCWRQRTAS